MCARARGHKGGVAEGVETAAAPVEGSMSPGRRREVHAGCLKPP